MQQLPQTAQLQLARGHPKKKRVNLESEVCVEVAARLDFAVFGNLAFAGRISIIPVVVSTLNS